MTIPRVLKLRRVLKPVGVLRRAGCWRIGVAGVLLGIGLAGCSTPEIGDGPLAVGWRELPAGIGDAHRRLTGSSLGLAERTQVASTLIEIDAFDADRALAAALGRDQPVIVWRAVLQAVATDAGEPPRGLWRPMLAMLYHVDDAVVADVVAAMGRYDDATLLERLRRAAASDDLPVRERSRAIAALGPHRSQGVAGLLVKLTKLTEPTAVQASAYAALATLTGIDRFGQDRRAWGEWWAASRKLDTLAWQRHLIENFARKLASGRATDQQLAEKLREAQQDLYQLSEPENQASVLAYMLESPLVDTRLLALDLAQNRLTQNGTFDPPLREALRDRLDDAVARVRWRSAELLRDLTDEPGADAVAIKLIQEEESVNRVRSAYLQLIARLPRKGVTEPAYALLEEPGLRADACATLAAIQQAQMLTPKRKDAVLERLRGYLDGGQRPSPQMINLLGRIGENDDWKRIERWIDDREDVIRQAAAQAWADSTTRSLAILAERADQPIIQPIVIRAAAERGQDPQTLRKLAANPPSQAQFVPAWERALIEMAGRVSARDALRTVVILRQQRDNPDLFERLFSAALAADEQRRSAANDQDPPLKLGDKIELHLQRAENRRVMGKPGLAINDFEAVLALDTLQLADAQRKRLYEGLIPACLDAHRNEPAFAYARAYFEDPANPNTIDPDAASDPLMEVFLDTAQREAELGRLDAARNIFDGFQLLVGPNRKISAALMVKIQNLQSRLDGTPTPDRP